MSIVGYPVKRVGPELVFLFESTNARTGHVTFKVVTYETTKKYGRTYYNLALGDIDDNEQEVNHHNVTNNGDMRKVIATAVSTLQPFFQELPDAVVHIEGSNEVRNHYYQKLVRDYMESLNRHYHVRGMIGRLIEDFYANKRYDCLLISLKKK